MTPFSTESVEQVSAVPREVLTNLWKLFFKTGMNPRAELIFPFNGTKEEAIKRGRAYCLNVNFKFIHVEPFLVDLDESERYFKEKNH